MKKIILSLAAVLAFSAANAQDKKQGTEGFAKGDLFVSGVVTLSNEKTGDNKENAFLFEPRVAYFVTENIAVGAKLGFGSDKSEAGSVTTQDRTAFTLGAFGRYYFTPASKFSLFANLGFDLNNWENKLNNAKEKEFQVGLGLGMNYFVSSNFSLEAGVGALTYSSNDNGGNGADKTNTLSFGGDWRAVTFGVNYKF